MRAAARLDVLLPTHNRAALLERCIRSVLSARPVPSLDVQLTVVCNGCADNSAEVVRRLQAAFPRRVSLIEERRRGKSRALNAAIAATSGSLVAMIDDDEEVDPHWIEVIAAAFDDPAVDFIGGPYIPVWGSPRPDWLPRDYLAVLGSADSGTEPRDYGPGFDGMLKGGNAVIRREVLERAGPYAEYLGPGSFAQLFSCEDEDMFYRLLEMGARGKYRPDLVIYHYIAAQRLTREYYRSWCFWRGVSMGLMDRRHRMKVAYLGGIPRYLWGEAGRGLWRMATKSRRQQPHERFTDELRVWDLAGYFYGKHIYTLARFSPARSRRKGDSLPEHRRRMEMAG